MSLPKHFYIIATVFSALCLSFPTEASHQDFSLAVRDDPTIQSRKWTKNCQSEYNTDVEGEAWNGMKTLSEAALRWQANGNYQSTADYWFGNDSSANYKRIRTIFENVIKFHDTSYWNGGPLNDAYTETWCGEQSGPDGQPPLPDGEASNWTPTECKPPRQGKDPGGIFAYSYQRDNWWNKGLTYYTVLCPRTLDWKVKLQHIDDYVNKYGKNVLEMDLAFKIRASTYLHETLHHRVVSNPDPRVLDVCSIGGGGGVAIYGPKAAASLAAYQGTRRTEPDDSNKPGFINHEFGTIINADNYIAFALSIYLQERFSIQEPIKPKDPTLFPPEKMEPGNCPRGMVATAENKFETLLDEPSTNDYPDLPFQSSPPAEPAMTTHCITGQPGDPVSKPFKRDDAIKSIDDFCGRRLPAGTMLVPPIDFNKKSKSGDTRPKILGFDNTKAINAPIADGIWLYRRYYDERCVGTQQYDSETTPEANKKVCVDNFMRILDNCQTDTVIAKYGGAMANKCDYYQLVGRNNTVTNVFAPKPAGPLICWPVDATVLPALKGKCTCMHANYYATDTFEAPASGNCAELTATTAVLST